jgi:hypothetical protein
MQRALEIAQQAVDAHNAANAGRGGIQAVANKCGFSRSALSTFLAGKYPAASTDKIEAAILKHLVGRHACSHLGRDLARDECRAHADRPMPMSNPAALRHWQACQDCAHRTEGGNDVTAK